MSALKGLGITTYEQNTDVPREIEFDKLPLVVELPAPKVEERGLVGAKTQVEQGKFGSTVVPAVASEMSSDMIGSPTARLLVLFHGAHPEQFSRVRQLLDEVIDRPARQIFVEGLILEISNLGIKELGVEWQFHRGNFDLSMGSLTAGILEPADTVNFLAQKSQDFELDWAAKIRALIIDGKAEILSRPSVLTLNNRQATIRIGQDIPIATSREGLTGGTSTISFDFKYLALGILLNIRPRINQDDSEVSLMVDTMVSSKVPGGELEIRDSDGNLLASAPAVDSRRVQTYARVQNNTPFIIGGLVSRTKTTYYNKIPILGSIPLLGYLFRSESSENLQREVIIVLTPYIIPEKIYLSRALPVGEHIDSTDQELFRDTVRVSTEDIADVSFIYNNQRFLAYRKLAQKAIRENFRLAEVPPFRWFAERRLPGERVIVNRIVYNVLERRNAARSIDIKRVAVLTAKHTGGYDVAFLERLLDYRKVGVDYESFFTTHPDQAVAMSFYDPYETPGGESLASEPVPEISIVDCKDRKEWGRLLWELNQPDQGGRKRFTILLHRERDLSRLQLAILVKLALHLNGGPAGVSLFNFIPGRNLEIPRVKEDHPFLVDAEIARYFFHSVHFYARALQRIEETLKGLDRELRRPEMRHLLEEAGLPARKS